MLDKQNVRVVCNRSPKDQVANMVISPSSTIQVNSVVTPYLYFPAGKFSFRTSPPPTQRPGRGLDTPL